MREHHKSIFLDVEVLVSQPSVQVIAVLVDHVVETDGDISKGNHNVSANVGVLGGLDNLEEQEEILLAEPGAHTHKLTECQCRSIAEGRILNTTESGLEGKWDVIPSRLAL